MNARILVQARGLSKAYPKVFHRRDRLRALVALLSGRRGIDTTSVLSDIDLEVQAGQSLGLIGENGAGKSTLLKLLVGVLTPSSGEVQVNGRVGALLELGAGFHPEYSGRENIALSAALYGLAKEEAQSRVPGIIEFADIGTYIDEPVKHYSSGMVVRLGFAVIASLRPDLLITDEILAVGDESFQKKCVRWMEEYLEDGGTLILVSHSMYHIQKLCSQACWIKQGRVEASGDVFDVTQAYLAYHERMTQSEAVAAPAPPERTAVEFELTEVSLNGQISELPLILEQGASLHVQVGILSRQDRVPVVSLGLGRADGTSIYGVGSDMDDRHPIRISENTYAIGIDFPDLPLLPGSYLLRVHVLDTEGVRLFDSSIRSITVRGKSREFGMIRLTHTWNDDPAIGAIQIKGTGTAS